jgi:hypothetical protein
MELRPPVLLIRVKHVTYPLGTVGRGGCGLTGSSPCRLYSVNANLRRGFDKASKQETLRASRAQDFNLASRGHQGATFQLEDRARLNRQE